MQENTNKSIAINSLILYIRLAIVSVSGLLYTRFSLQALGVTDYGLFSVIGCIISFSSIINSIMITTSNRFIALAIGKNDIRETCQQFNVNLAVHIAIAILTMAFALPIGHYYIDGYVSYVGDMEKVKVVFDISIVGTALSFIGVPYNGLLLARERFFVFCTTDVLMSLAKLVFTYMLISHFDNKLLFYTLWMSFMTAFPTVVYFVYCRVCFRDITRFVFVCDWKKYYYVFDFSIGIGIGAIAWVGKAQGGALIINMFFSTAMNASLAIATSVSSILQNFANNAQKPIAPQIVKNFAACNYHRCMQLVCLSSKLTYLAMFFISIPFLLVPETILGFWLKDVPPYAVDFTRLLIIDVLLVLINAGVNDYVFAAGKIKVYQIIINVILGGSVVGGYFVMKFGADPQYLYYVYILSSFIVFLIRPFIIKLLHIVDFDIKYLALNSYIPVLAVTMFFMPAFWLKQYVNPILCVFLAYIYFVLLLYVIGLNSNERNYINSFIKKKVCRAC